MKRRVGIYGGTFDPPHNGHIRAAQAFLRDVHSDALYIMPAAVPSHKQNSAVSKPEIRLALAHAAFDGLDERITVSDYEIMSDGVSYTYKTLMHFAEAEEAELYFLCGNDKFLSMGTWLHPEIIFSLASVVCVMRQKNPEAYSAVADAQKMYKERYGARTLVIEHHLPELSSSQIRQLSVDGGDVSPFIPEAVRLLIDACGLYRGE